MIKTILTTSICWIAIIGWTGFLLANDGTLKLRNSHAKIVELSMNDSRVSRDLNKLNQIIDNDLNQWSN